MNLISKSINKIDVQADDRLIVSMERNYYTGAEVRDIIIARYRRGNLRMRVLEAFRQMITAKKYSDEVDAAIKAIDAEVVVLREIETVLNAEPSSDNVVSFAEASNASAGNKKRIGKKARKAAAHKEQQTG